MSVCGVDGKMELSSGSSFLFLLPGPQSECEQGSATGSHHHWVESCLPHKGGLYFKVVCQNKTFSLKRCCQVFVQRDSNINAIINNLQTICHCSWHMIAAQNMAMILDSTPCQVTWAQDPSIVGCLLISQEHLLLKTDWELTDAHRGKWSLPSLN